MDTTCSEWPENLDQGVLWVTPWTWHCFFPWNRSYFKVLRSIKHDHPEASDSFGPNLFSSPPLWFSTKHPWTKAKAPSGSGASVTFPRFPRHDIPICTPSWYPESHVHITEGSLSQDSNIVEHLLLHSKQQKEQAMSELRIKGLLSKSVGGALTSMEQISGTCC